MGETEDGCAPTEECSSLWSWCFCSMEAAEDGRAPTEERSSLWSWCFCSMEAAEDGRAPTEERSSLWSWCFCSMGRPRMDALRQKSVRLFDPCASVRRGACVSRVTRQL